MLPYVNGEFGVVADPDIKINDKGNAWVKVRGVAKERVRDSNGAWTDGKTCFIDIWVSGKQAEHLADSVTKGDTITVTGRLEFSEWADKEGVKRTSYRILADNVGVSVRFKATKSAAVQPMSVRDISASLEADTPPF